MDIAVTHDTTTDRPLLYGCSIDAGYSHHEPVTAQQCRAVSAPDAVPDGHCGVTHDNSDAHRHHQPVQRMVTRDQRRHMHSPQILEWK